jgi:hypothetical protein
MMGFLKRLRTVLESKPNSYIVILLVIGFVVFLAKCIIVYPIQYIGYADAAAYAEMADSLIHGRGLEVDYISSYFLKYDAQVSRPEDHWPPLYSIAIAPFFLIFGKTAFAAKLPSIIISCFFLPLVVYLITKELTGNKFASLAAGLGVLFYPVIFEESLQSLSDVLYSFVVCAGVLFSMKALDDERFFYPLGVFMGLAYYAKGSGLIIIPGYILFQVMARRNVKKILISLLIAFLILLPWFIRNYVHFRDPLFSTQRFISSYIGFEGWEAGTYDLYWGEKPPPSYIDKVVYKGGIRYAARMTLDHLKGHFWMTFVDINSGRPLIQNGDKLTRWKGPAREAFPTYFVNIPALLGIVLLWGNRKRHIIWITAGSLILFTSIVWSPIYRLMLPIICLMMPLGWATHFYIIKTIFSRLKRRSRHDADAVSLSPRDKSPLTPLWKRGDSPGLWERGNVPDLWKRGVRGDLPGVLVCCLAVVVVLMSAESIYREYNRGAYPYHDSAWDCIDMGKWLKENASPDSITMTEFPWDLHFYSEQRAIQIPRASLQKTIEVMRFYKPEYLLLITQRIGYKPSLIPLVTGQVPGLELVYSNREMKLYRIRYDRLET